ncbi:aminotransferase class III-fold pyridoxal phosphate-dependent enzyme [Winogradskya consettensis]|uniref:Diaminobutyrate--pyruvate aminotransferase n=1 Tax=Winogradskya consettensis TaxID=113560 RepID=A0A919T031_9ACTN|nr:aminotransferase class III-fold pyridoxal phosphate-dependent enzyme [Actinoplanes consettensis]GIM81995.1 diaminobutyrate--pyruvate aminotransferase [Actinoplanes consettensis]
MTTVSASPELAEPALLGWLSTMGLDVDYVRAKGITLYRVDGDGTERAVTDLVGGYGSLILGHNHPELVAEAHRLLDADTPVHAQFSRHPYANAVANRLNAILRRELGTAEAFLAIFANTGAEAIEAGVKHAELDRVLRMRAELEAVDAGIAAARTAIDVGARVNPAVLLRLDIDAAAGPVAGFEAVAERVRAYNSEVVARPPLLFALEGSFHGKLMGSVQLTFNEGYRTPFSALGVQSRFLPLNDREALTAATLDAQVALLDVVVRGGLVELAERAAPVVTAVLVEPVQGEGGIRPVSSGYAAGLREACTTLGAPLIVDEIQSGMGRTGAFLASSLSGLRGDYYTLAKSLGGGLAKTSVLLVRESRYRPDFEFLHSSTFAKDGYSCGIALKVLDLLEADDGRVYRVAAERGRRVKEMLSAVRAEFPDVIEEVRGTGLMLGMQFTAQERSSSAVLRENAPLLGYLLAGYLLREHDLRVFPTASNVTTLRFEPSVQITDAEITRLQAGLRAVCALLRAGDGDRLAQL